jgi:hypothetical protein
MSRDQLPKTLRIIVLVSGNGALSATTAQQYQNQKINYAQRGFSQIASFRAPLRRLGHGWFPLLSPCYTSLIHRYGL